VILGEIIAAQIERRLHIDVDRKLNLGGTLIAHEALTSGSIDLYPEYTGTALTEVLHRPIEKDAAVVLDRCGKDTGRCRSPGSNRSDSTTRSPWSCSPKQPARTACAH
jgi:glycine betaine/choline ABC-type transport system substrate-binding protein